MSSSPTSRDPVASGLDAATAARLISVEVTMPDPGSAEPVEVVRWLRRPGDRVFTDDSLCIVAWSGNTAEITSPATGILRTLVVGVGARATASATLARIDVALAAAAPEPEPAPAPESPPLPDPEPAPAPEPPSEPIPAIDHAPGEQVVEVPLALLRDAPREPAPARDLRAFRSPAVRRFARDHHLDLETVPGSGRDGRVTLDDVRAALAGRNGDGPQITGHSSAGA